MLVLFRSKIANRIGGTAGTMPNGQAHYIVFANEKGGTGKSTTAVHVAVALATQGHKVGVIDLDPRQRTVTRYLENREETSRRRGVTLPTPTYAVFEGDTLDARSGAHV